MSSENIINLTDANFESSILDAKEPVLVDFWAEWCGPCKSIAPILAELADEYAGKLTIAKLDIDKNSATAPKYGIRNIPTLLLFKDGEIVANSVGLQSKKQLKALIDANLI